MISFKTFLKIRYPEWENEKFDSIPQRPNITEMIRANKSFQDLPDLLLTFYAESRRLGSLDRA
jgi:hypothetical protein